MEKDKWYVKLFYGVIVIIILNLLADIVLGGIILVLSSFFNFDVTSILLKSFLLIKFPLALIGIFIAIYIYKNYPAICGLFKLKSKNQWILILLIILYLLSILLYFLGIDNLWVIPRIVILAILEICPFFMILFFYKHHSSNLTLKLKALLIIFLILLNPLFVFAINFGYLTLYSRYLSMCGVEVADITAGGVAAESGLEIGDIIISVNGKDVKNINSYRSFISGLDLKEPLTFILKNGETYTFTAKADYDNGIFDLGFNSKQAIC